MEFTIGNLEYIDYSDGSLDGILEENMESILKELYSNNSNGVMLREANLIGTREGSVIATIESVYNGTLSDDQNTDAVLVIYNQVKIPSGFHPYNVTDFKVSVDGNFVSVTPCYGSSCPAGLNCVPEADECFVNCSDNSESGYCMNDGRCIEPEKPRRAEEGLICLCLSNFSGKRCENRIESTEGSSRTPLPTEESSRTKGPSSTPGPLPTTGEDPEPVMPIVIVLGCLAIVFIVITIVLIFCVANLIRPKDFSYNSRNPYDTIPLFTRVVTSRPTGILTSGRSSGSDHSSEQDETQLTINPLPAYLDMNDGVRSNLPTTMTDLDSETSVENPHQRIDPERARQPLGQETLSASTHGTNFTFRRSHTQNSSTNNGSFILNMFDRESEPEQFIIAMPSEAFANSDGGHGYRWDYAGSSISTPSRDEAIT